MIPIVVTCTSEPRFLICPGHDQYIYTVHFTVSLGDGLSKAAMNPNLSALSDLRSWSSQACARGDGIKQPPKFKTH